MRTESLAFYSTAAQIMPVLFIALVIQTVREDRRPVRTSLLIIVAAALLAEVLSFQTLASGQGSDLKTILVGEGLWIAGLTLSLRILLQAFSAVATKGERDDTNLIAMSGAVVLFVGIVLIAVL
jgi:ABC-type Mn2+/Zn2+ transport system permease subunit